jgi:hypothetical protein
VIENQLKFGEKSMNEKIKLEVALDADAEQIRNMPCILG